MFDTLKEEDPKTYILLTIMINFLILGGVVCMLYLTAMTKYEGYHIFFAIAGFIFLGIALLELINIGVQVSRLKTRHDWEAEKKEGRAKLQFQLETKRMDVLLEKIKKGESLDPDELKLVKDLEVDILNQTKQGEPSG